MESRTVGSTADGGIPVLEARRVAGLADLLRLEAAGRAWRGRVFAPLLVRAQRAELAPPLPPAVLPRIRLPPWVAAVRGCGLDALSFVRDLYSLALCTDGEASPTVNLVFVSASGRPRCAFCISAVPEREISGCDVALGCVAPAPWAVLESDAPISLASWSVASLADLSLVSSCSIGALRNKGVACVDRRHRNMALLTTLAEASRCFRRSSASRALLAIGLYRVWPFFATAAALSFSGFGAPRWA